STPASQSQVQSTAETAIPASQEPGSRASSPVRVDVQSGPRPGWVERQPEDVEGESRVSLASGLFPTSLDCSNDLAVRARNYLGEYFAKEYGARQGGELLPKQELDRLVEGSLIRERYVEPVKSDVLETTMYRMHGLVVITPELRGKLENLWRRQVV